MIPGNLKTSHAARLVRNLTKDISKLEDYKMFNKKYTKLVAATGMTLFAGVAQAANTFDIADNGGFETGDTSGWTVFGGGGVSTVNPASGLYSGQGTCIGGPCDVLFKNANKGIGVAQAGGSITINFDYRHKLMVQ